MSIQKLLQGACRKAKSTAQTIISNDINFCCQVMDDITVSNDDDTLYPSNEDMDVWYKDLFTNEFKLKVLPPKAIENMKNRGISIKKQPAEIMNFVVGTNKDRVYVGIMLPDECLHKVDDLIKGFMGNDKYNFNNYEKYSVLSYEVESPLKEKDNCQRRIFEHLKVIGVSDQNDESDDDVYTFDNEEDEKDN